MSVGCFSLNSIVCSLGATEFPLPPNFSSIYESTRCESLAVTCFYTRADESESPGMGRVRLCRRNPSRRSEIKGQSIGNGRNPKISKQTSIRPLEHLLWFRAFFFPPSKNKLVALFSWLSVLCSSPDVGVLL